MMKYLKEILLEEITSIMAELSMNAYKEAEQKIENLKFSDAMTVLYNLAKENKISNTQFIMLKNILAARANSKKSVKTEDIITEMSVSDIKERIKEILKLEEVQKYKIDEFSYENIPFEIFQANGILPTHLKQYKLSNDIITFDLGIDINPIKKNVDIFLQKSGLFD